MLKQTSKNFRQFFLLEFTKELIRSTNTYKEFKIKKEVKVIVHEKPIKQIPPQEVLLKRRVLQGAVKEKIKRDTEIISYLKEGEILSEFKKFSLTKPLSPKAPLSYKMPSLLAISGPKFPETVRDLRPTLTSRTIMLEKLDPLVKDPLVRAIECNGPNERVIVTGAMGRKSTKIILTKEEVSEIIKKFSDASKIPIHEGIFRVVFGDLSLSAIVSEIIGSKFLIKKISGTR
ncbi:MAG TPA: hypothetical protein VMV95_00840 [Bacillota bacterium]|nr:hypothetical protein [Bacillota bacterium]